MLIEERKKLAQLKKLRRENMKLRSGVQQLKDSIMSLGPVKQLAEEERMQIDNIISAQLDKTGIIDKQSFNNMLTLDNTHISIGSKYGANDYLSRVNSDPEPSFDPTGSPDSKLTANAKEKTLGNSLSAGSVELRHPPRPM